jgi:hypothetical protein
MAGLRDERYEVAETHEFVEIPILDKAAPDIVIFCSTIHTAKQTR